MKHFGDITKIDGAAVPIVDVVTGGSPCQDLSVAGRRAGLQGERSGLFMEQVRVVKEMRAHDMADGRPVFLVRPRFMVWENVPGAFSSNGGKDFQAVLQEICRIVCEEAPAVPVPQNGWPKSGCLSGVGDTGCTFSIAWRLHDAQFWGVPQRRKRIALVADFGGLSAPEVLFERKSLRWDPEPGGEARETAAGATGGGIEGASGAMNPWDTQSARVYSDRGVWHSLNANENGGQSRDSVLQSANAFGETGKGYWQKGVQTLRAEGENRPSRPSNCVVMGVDVYNQTTTGNVSKSIVYENHSQDSRYKPLGEVCQTVSATYGMGGNNQPLVVDDVLPFDTTQVTSDKNWSNPHFGDPCHPLAAGMHPPAVAMCIGNGQADIASHISEEVCQTLNCMHDAMTVCVGNGQLNQMSNTYQTITGTLNPGAHPGSYNGQDVYNDMLIAQNTANAIVRRLTPMECERLQGFPDGWTDIGEWTDSKGKKHKDADSPRYKALGNSIAVGYANNQSGFWCWLARRICAQYERRVTMASLFDGIGGFPLAFAACGAVPVWASEIEEFPMAVTKIHFPEEEE